YLSSEESLATMAVPKDFQIEVFADEQQFPELVNPVQMQVDAKGRLWAAVWPTYPKQQPIRDINDALLIFKDTDRDGRADQVVKFAEVPNPLGFEFWNGGVIVSAQPNLLFLRDTDGDDIADERYVLLHGLGSADSHHAANNLIYGPCGGIYWQSGIFLHNNFEHPWGPSLSTGHSGQYRFDPRRFTVATHGRHGSNPHGIAFDAWGYHFITDGTGGNAVQVHPHGNGWGTRKLINKEVRPVPANSILSSSHFPEEMQQDFLICNAIGFLGIKQYRFDYGGTPGSKRKEGEVWGEPSGEELTVTMDGREVKSAGLLLSGDRNFRPTDAVFGEDGALYVSDWANVIIGHMQHNVRDPKRDYQHGRIFRISHKTRPLQEPVPIAGASLEQLMKNLEHPVDGVRHRTRIELSSRDTKEVIAACRTWMKQFDPKKAEHAHHLLEALWLHQAHNVRNTELLTAMIQSPELRARVAAQTVQHHWFAADPTGGKGVTREEVVEVEEKKKSGIISDSSELTEIRIGTIVEKLSYDVTKLTIKSGKKIRLTFDNTDHMPHNLVVTQPGASQEIGLAAAAMGAEGFARDFLPDSDKIIAATKMLDGGTEETIDLITRDDIVAMHEKLFARSELVVGVVGAISEEELKLELDKVFGDLPETSGAVPVDEVQPILGENVNIEMSVPNSRISLVYRGLKRDDPDFFAAHLMNHILGGGTFSSRLYTEVREKRGLAYGVSSGIATFENTAYLSAGTSTRADNQEEAIRIMKEEIRRLAEDGVTAEELEAAKKFVSGSYAIANLDTSGKIARVLVAIQSNDLGIDYIDRRKELIEKVTLEDVNRIAKKLLSAEPTQVVVGPATQ
ncbi:MAG: PVC-type heme-binding CxxCH protein, partial [Pseudomonadota bacterium]